jgi:tetratricopeptide (TPR) repeat protein/tRNA A-37 threonylcarbamoyl transferase component Bud32
MSDEDIPTRSASELAPEGRMIGDYRIVRRLGEGGMGVVYEAEQQHPRRAVALKVIRGGRFVDENTVRLFRREAQTLARLKHPGIAAIHESGCTEDGAHFFAMELVRGETLGEWIRNRPRGGELTRDELQLRLNLFRKICDAVAYAHQRGVVHRDLKPSNILVLHDSPSGSSTSSAVSSPPEIKILDFGLARITESDVAMTTVVTELGKIQGTLPYMSPEQVRGDSDEIDLRTDVYSLGVVLYELLTGNLPHDVRGAALAEAARLICEERPRSLTESWPGRRRPDRDLGTIAHKALEKQASRRYQSVNALAEDVERYLGTQPILARPPGALYQLRKMVARHRVGFGFAALVVLAGVVVTVIMVAQARRLAEERARVEQAEIYRHVSHFLTDLFTIADPSEPLGNTITAREILDAGAVRIREELGDQPAVQARVMNLMGGVYRRLGLYNSAQPLLEGALDSLRGEGGGSPLEIASTEENLGILCERNGEYGRARELYESALATREAELGPDHPDVAAALSNLGNLAMREGDLETARAHHERGLALREEALGPDHLEVARSLANLSILELRVRNLEGARLLYERALTIMEAVLPPEHPDLARALSHVAALRRKSADLEGARELYERAAQIREKVLGPDHVDLARVLNNLGVLLVDMREYEGALIAHQRALEIRKEALGDDHKDVAQSLNNLALALWKTGEYETARSHLERSLAIRENALGPTHVRVTHSYYNLASLMAVQHKREEALVYLREAVDRGFAEAFIRDDPDLASLRGDPEFEALVAEVMERVGEG